jgi:hypothetical protein
VIVTLLAAMLTVGDTMSDPHKHDFSNTISDSTLGSTTTETCRSSTSSVSGSGMEEEEEDSVGEEQQKQKHDTPLLSATTTFPVILSSTQRSHSLVSTESDDVKILTHMLTRPENDPTWVACSSGTTPNFKSQPAAWYCPAADVKILTHMLTKPENDPTACSSGTKQNDKSQSAAWYCPAAWHSISHSAHRRQMQVKIEELLLGYTRARNEATIAAAAAATTARARAGEENTSSSLHDAEECCDCTDPSYLDSVSTMCDVIENRLYYCATSLQQYTDVSSLPARLLELVKTILAEFQAEGREIDSVLATGSQSSSTGISMPTDTNTSSAVISTLGSSQALVVETEATVTTADGTPGISDVDVDATTTPGKQSTNKTTVSSQGCSRLFIVKVLFAVR